MPLQPSLLWTWNRTIDRVPYLLTGALLFLVKFAIDWTVAYYGFGQAWSPLNYLIWPNDRVMRVLELRDPDRWFSLTMLTVSLPFIWCGVILTLHRLRAAGLPLGLIVLFFIPLVNLIFFLVLLLLPTREPVEGEAPWDAGTSQAITVLAAGESAADELSRPTGVTRPPRRGRRPVFEPLREIHRSIVLESYWRSGLVALAVTVPLIVLAVYIGAQLFQSYGFSLFVGAPFALGLISVLVFGFSRPQPFWACLIVALATCMAAGGVIVVIALEGIICLIMAAPIAGFLAFFGAVIGYAIQARPWLSEQVLSVIVAVVLVLPALMAAESENEPEPALRAVCTTVIVAAAPEQVWQHVIAFPPLPEPDDWFFRTGIAYPQRAEIHGSGVGAVRHCVFSTGTFVEPIEDWDPPWRLRFRVTDQPEPLREWSPYHIHPAHLDHYLCSRRGEFLLERLPDGRTRLTGTTWYTNRMWPAAYWHLWSDYIIHRIHERVLVHIQKLVEAP
jgi:hypothetical protein